MMSSSTVSHFLLLSLLSVTQADLYLHSPPGSNNRNRERNDNRNNANRLFDSQNNGKGGYPWRGDPRLNTQDGLTYYVGSDLRIEWTVQHGCGANPNVHCELVIQVACDSHMPNLRDGYPQSTNCFNSDNTQNQAGQGNVDCSDTTQFLARKWTTNTNDGTNTIPENRNTAFYEANVNTADGLQGAEYGMHEDNTFYQTCKNTARNKRLYTSDQKLKGNTQRFTRQNPNGGRRGLECPEERDYYPWWQPSPFEDVAVLVSNLTYCQSDLYQKESQNVKARFYCACVLSEVNNNNPCPITEAACAAKGYTWTERAAWGVDPPECLLHPMSRDNHLGNAIHMKNDGSEEVEAQPETAHYDWKIPAHLAGQQCVLRLRYNMSTYDYDSHSFVEPNTASVGYDSSFNCPFVTAADCGNADPDCEATQGGVVPACYTKLTSASVPLQNRPYINLFEQSVADNQGFKLGLAINTHQTGRTFQDRSYVFNIANAPSNAAGKTIHNLGLRGRRGNIVQAYPAVEYDFVPSLLEVTEGDYVHIQFHGSDFNAAKNANNGEGWKYSDRTNMVQMDSRTLNYPQFHSKNTLFPDLAEAKKWAWVGQEETVQTCLDINYYDNGDSQRNDINNCGKLNRMKNRYPQNPQDGLVQMNNEPGEYYYMSTRNNNFSNRAMKGQITVGKSGDDPDALAEGETMGAVFAGFFGVGAAGSIIFTVAKWKALL